eukprot:763764-Hanusia_phi.AAC.6
MPCRSRTGIGSRCTSARFQQSRPTSRCSQFCSMNECERVYDRFWGEDCNLLPPHLSRAAAGMYSEFEGEQAAWGEVKRLLAAMARQRGGEGGLARRLAGASLEMVEEEFRKCWGLVVVSLWESWCSLGGGDLWWAVPMLPSWTVCILRLSERFPLGAITTWLMFDVKVSFRSQYMLPIVDMFNHQSSRVQVVGICRILRNFGDL